MNNLVNLADIIITERAKVVRLHNKIVNKSKESLCYYFRRLYFLIVRNPTQIEPDDEYNLSYYRDKFNEYSEKNLIGEEQEQELDIVKRMKTILLEEQGQLNLLTRSHVANIDGVSTLESYRNSKSEKYGIKIEIVLSPTTSQTVNVSLRHLASPGYEHRGYVTLTCNDEFVKFKIETNKQTMYNGYKILFRLTLETAISPDEEGFKKDVLNKIENPDIFEIHGDIKSFPFVREKLTFNSDHGVLSNTIGKEHLYNSSPTGDQLKQKLFITFKTNKPLSKLLDIHIEPSELNVKQNVALGRIYENTKISKYFYLPYNENSVKFLGSPPTSP